MYRIGIDVGSTYTKYCVMNSEEILELWQEKSPLKQKHYFEDKVEELHSRFPKCSIVSCGYGKRNVETVQSINELTALAKGTYYITNKDGLVLDIGGQDTKIIEQKNGYLSSFFLNDKCAAGSGMFLTSVLERVGRKFSDIDLRDVSKPLFQLSSVCAVFAQSEIVELIADDKSEEEIIYSVIWQILTKAKALLWKVDDKPIILSGGLTQIPGFAEYASMSLGRECVVMENSDYIAAIGCALQDYKDIIFKKK